MWCWCLPTKAGWRALFGELHRRYTGYVNARRRTTGHLWQGRFGSVAMDEAHFVTALRYVALNPVRAGLAARKRGPQRWTGTPNTVSPGSSQG